MVPFTVEEENLICMYHKSDRRRTAANIRAALPDMDEDMAALARQTADKLDAIPKRQHPIHSLWLYLTYPGRAGGRRLCKSAGTGTRHFDPALCVGAGRR